MRIQILDSIHALPAAQWNRLLRDSDPFLRHEFLAALEDSGSVGDETGWTPCHVVLHEDAEVRAACPLYLKSHSMGEYVFDWAWADFWQRHGQPYYPKLVSAVPFTPIAGQRLLLAPGLDTAGREYFSRALCDAIRELATTHRASSWHVLFPDRDDDDLLAKAGLLQRKAWNYVWHNPGYRDFDDFLAALTSKKRKNIRRERRLLAEQGIVLHQHRGDDADDASWRAFYACYHSTYLKRGRFGYLTENFFHRLRQQIPEQLVLNLARRDGQVVGAALCLRSDDTLYGRYWGCLQEVDSLHFECCYYSGIEYCIREGLRRFDPGVQGEHKIARGFLPTLTQSRHWIAEPAFEGPVARFLQEEAAQVDALTRTLQAHSPFRR